MKSDRIPVLMYHRLGDSHNDWEQKYCVSPKRFAAHMHKLAKNGYTACTIEDFMGWLNKKIQLPDKSFLITFDDGFLGVYEHAVKILNELGWSATIFLVSNLIGKQDYWTQTQNPNGHIYPLLELKHIKHMQEMGFAFHSHTRNHHDLSTLSVDELKKELAGSRKDLEDLLGEQVTYLAYPFGRFNDNTVSIAQSSGYEAAFSTQPGFNRSEIDAFKIRRIDVFGTDTPRMLKRKISLGTNDGSWQHTLRYYLSRVMSRV